MPLATRVARAFCVVLTAGAVSLPDLARGREIDRQSGLGGRDSVAQVGAPASRAGSGLVLDRLSKGHLRTWRAIGEIVAASDASGQPRSPTLRGLWEWAHAASHVIHVEMVSPSKVANGLVGVFQVERVDPSGLRHVAVLRICPTNIRRAVAGSGPNSVDSFVRFLGLTEVERYAEVLAHELAHAQYFLESPERVAQLEAAQRTRAEFLSGSERSIRRLPEDLGRRLRESFAVLAACEAYAESVEAVVLKELAGDRSTRLAGLPDR
jgi:hypothetical protein